MQITDCVLAEITPEITKQISDIHERIFSQPEWAFQMLWLLSIIITVAVIIIFLRQKKIAQNQVELGQLIAHLIEQKK